MEYSFEELAAKAAEFAMKDKKPAERRKPGLADIVQMVVIGGVTAAVIHMFSLPRFEEKIDENNRLIVKLELRLDKLQQDMYVPRGSKAVILDDFKKTASIDEKAK